MYLKYIFFSEEWNLHEGLLYNGQIIVAFFFFFLWIKYNILYKINYYIFEIYTCTFPSFYLRGKKKEKYQKEEKHAIVLYVFTSFSRLFLFGVAKSFKLAIVAMQHARYNYAEHCLNVESLRG